MIVGFKLKLFDKISIILRGNRENKLPVELKQGDNCVVNILNVQELSISQIENLTDSHEDNSPTKNLKNRFLVEQLIKQNNLSSVIKKATLEKIENPVNLEKNWFLKWMDTAQQVDKEDMQNVLAKILSGEIKKPGTFSFRTLEVVRSISQKELKIFKKFVALVWSNDSVILLGKSLFNNFVLDKYGISYDDFLVVNEAGLISSSNSVKLLDFKKDQQIGFIIGGTNFIKITTKENEKLSVNALLFTLVGQEIAPLVMGENSKKDEYIADLNKYLDSIL